MWQNNDERDTFGLYNGEKLIHVTFEFEGNPEIPDNTDIRDIIEVRSIDYIYDTILEAKNNKENH